MTFWNMAKKHLIEMSRYPINFFSSFIIIVLLIFMFMFCATMFTSDDSSNTKTIFGFAIYGMVIFLLLMVGMGIGYSIREEQLRGTLESLYMTPANRFTNLISRNFVIFIVELGLIMLILIFVTLVIAKLPVNNLFTALYILFMTMFSIFGLSFILAGLTLKLKQTINIFFQMFQFFFMIFCAMFFPFKALPDFIVKYVCMFIPFSYSVDAFRTVLVNVEPELLPLSQEIVIITACGVGMMILGILYFKYMERKVRIAGTLGEY